MVHHYLNSRIPSGPLPEKWDNCRFSSKLVSPANRRKYEIIVVGTGLAGASAAATLGELGYSVKAFCLQDSPRRAHSIAAQGGINAAKNYQNDGDSVFRLFYDTIKGGDFRSREANVYRLAQVSNAIIDHCVAQGVQFAREYGWLRSFGGAQVSRTFYARGQTGQQLLLGAYSSLMRQAVAEAGGTAQFAGGVPAMCDGITQGESGMDLSLMSRDVIALATVIALSHNVFDGALLLGVCDKIVPGLLMGGLQYGHLPMILVPAGPMTSGISNREKNQVRERFAQGHATQAELLASELLAYHSPGTCTFYGTANSNQLMAEMLGVHLPGASFVNAETPLRDALTKAAATRLTALTHLGNKYTPLAEVISEKAVVNAMVGVLATGGSTNETMHLVAIAKAAGILINWDDFAELSAAVPLLVRIYPNGSGDINSFQQAGGMALLIRELLAGGFLHEDVRTVAGPGFSRYVEEPVLAEGKAVWQQGPEQSRDPAIIAPLEKPFAQVSGIKVLSGNLGRAIMKISALADGENTCVEAPAMVFHSQLELEQAFKDGRMNRDLVAVLRFQGPRANGMPELHKLITFLSILMDQGHKVGLVTDGRLSGASGKVPFAIHCTPEALADGLIAKVQDGDLIRMDARNNLLELKVSQAVLANRQPAPPPPESTAPGHGIFAALRRVLAGAEDGASSLFP